MSEIQSTNVCCVDLREDCVNYLKSLDLSVYEGSLGSIFSFSWGKAYTHSRYVLSDFHLPDNLHEYHVFLCDTDNPRYKEYKSDEHQINDIADPNEKCLTCLHPINILDLRPYGTSMLEHFFKNNSRHQRIEIVFLGAQTSVSYTASKVGYMSSNTIGAFSNYAAWGLLHGNDKCGNRVVFADNNLSRMLYDGKLNQINYYHVFNVPYVDDDKRRKPDPNFIPLLSNEDGECVSYLYLTRNGSLFCVLPQVEDKVSLLKSLFENILFVYYSDFFPDIEARRWIHKTDYLLPEEVIIRRKIEAKREEYEKEIADMKKLAQEAGERNEFLKLLLTGTGDQLVKAVKTYLEWLGFKDVINKDETLKEGEIKEEDLDLSYNGQLVLLEVKGINGTSTDSECSQINKVVLRRMKQLKTTDVHGIYIVNNQKNVEPLRRQIPPFNDNQISDALNQDRTLIYTGQLFALYSDIENGYVSKDEARECFLKPGLADFHNAFKTLGKPYHFYQENTVICIDLKGERVSVGDTLYYQDSLQRLVGMTIESIQQDHASVSTADSGKTAIKVDKACPYAAEVFCKHIH